MVDSSTSRREGSVWHKTCDVKLVLLFCITWVSMQPVAGAVAGPSLAEACKSGVASFLTWKKTRFANVKLNFVSCLPQDAVGLLPAGCSHQGESPPAAFYPSASTFGPLGWCSAGLSPAPAMWFPYDQLSQYLTNLSYLEGLDWVTVSDVDVALRSLKNLHLHLHLHQRVEGCCSEIGFLYFIRVFALSACNLIVYQGLQTSIGAKSIKDIKNASFA